MRLWERGRRPQSQPRWDGGRYSDACPAGIAAKDQPLARRSLPCRLRLAVAQDIESYQPDPP